MAITGADYLLIDTDSGIFLGADVTVIVPEVFGGVAYDIMYDADAAIEYADAQGVAIELPGAAELALNTLDSEPRGYLAIDLEQGTTVDPAGLRLVPARELDSAEDEDEVLELAKTAGEVPSVPVTIRDLEGLPFESVNA